MKAVALLAGALLAALAPAWAQTPSIPSVNFDLEMNIEDVAMDFKPVGSWTAERPQTPEADPALRALINVDTSGQSGTVRFKYTGYGFTLNGGGTYDTTSTAALATITIGGLDVPFSYIGNGSITAATHAFQPVIVEVTFLRGEWNIGSVTVRTTMLSQAPSFDYNTVNVQRPARQNGGINDVFDLTGRWDTAREDTLADGSFMPAHVEGYYNAQMTIPIPANTSYIMLNGTRGRGGGNFSITYSPQPLIQNGVISKYEGNAQSTLGEIEFPLESYTVLHAAVLDPTEMYDITMRVGAGTVGLASVTFFSSVWDGTTYPRPKSDLENTLPQDLPDDYPSDPPPAPKKKTNIGAIVGGVIGGVIGLLLILGLLWVLCVRRRSRAQHKASKAAMLDAFNARHGSGSGPGVASTAVGAGGAAAAAGAAARRSSFSGTRRSSFSAGGRRPSFSLKGGGVVDRSANPFDDGNAAELADLSHKKNGGSTVSVVPVSGSPSSSRSTTPVGSPHLQPHNAFSIDGGAADMDHTPGAYPGAYPSPAAHKVFRAATPPRRSSQLSDNTLIGSPVAKATGTFGSPPTSPTSPRRPGTSPPLTSMPAPPHHHRRHDDGWIWRSPEENQRHGQNQGPHAL